MRRRSVIASIGLAIVLFLIVSALLTRALGVGDAQRGAVTALVRAEARGDAAGVTSLIEGCGASAACRTQAAALASHLRHPGSVSILQFTPTTNFAVSGSAGTARVAWLVGGSLPRTQCVRVRNSGSVLAGFTIRILQVSARLASDASCPSRF